MRSLKRDFSPRFSRAKKGGKEPKMYISNWDEYLREKKVEAAPDEAFKQFIPPPADNLFEIGTILGVVDKAMEGRCFLATVIAKKGYRIQVEHMLTNGSTKQWFCIDSDELKVLKAEDLKKDLFSIPEKFGRDIASFPCYLEKELGKRKGT